MVIVRSSSPLSTMACFASAPEATQTPASPLDAPVISWGMGIIALIERLLAKQARPTEPARSVFGAEADREAANQATANEYEFEVEKGKSRPQGF